MISDFIFKSYVYNSILLVVQIFPSLLLLLTSFLKSSTVKREASLTINGVCTDKKISPVHIDIQYTTLHYTLHELTTVAIS